MLKLHFTSFIFLFVCRIDSKKMNSCSTVIIMMMFIIIITVCVGCSGVCSVYPSVHLEQSDCLLNADDKKGFCGF